MSSVFCTKCGKQAADQAKFCGGCGEPISAGTAAPPPAPKNRKKPSHSSTQAIIVLALMGLLFVVAARISNKDNEQSSIAIRHVYAKHDNLIVRESAMESARKVISVKAGQQFLEISRSGMWMEVGVANAEGKTGWVPISSTTIKKTSGRGPKK